jgi:hypothetical protein
MWFQVTRHVSYVFVLGICVPAQLQASVRGRGASAEARGTQQGATGSSLNVDGFSSHASASSTHTNKVVAPEARARNDQGSPQTASRATERATEASSFPRQGAHDDGNAKQEPKTAPQTAAPQTAAAQAAAPRAAALQAAAPQAAAPETAAQQAPPAPVAIAAAVVPAPGISATGSTSSSMSAAATVSGASAASALSASVSPSSAPPAPGPAAVRARPSPPPMVVLSRSGEHTASRVLEGKVAAPRKDESGVKSDTRQGTDEGDSNHATDPKPQARPEVARPDVATFIPVGREEETGRGSSPTPVRKGTKRGEEEARSGDGDQDAVQIAEKELFPPEKKVAGARTGTTRQEQTSSKAEENEGRTRTGKREVRGRVDEEVGMRGSTRNVGKRASRLGGGAEQGDAGHDMSAEHAGAHVEEESRGTARNTRRRAPGAPTSGQSVDGRPPSFEGGKEGVVDVREDDGDAGGQDTDVDVEAADSPLRRPVRGRRGHALRHSSRAGTQSADEDKESEKKQSRSDMEEEAAGARQSGQPSYEPRPYVREQSGRPSRPASVTAEKDVEEGVEESDAERMDSRRNSMRPEEHMYGEQRSPQNARDVARGGEAPRGEKRRESTGRARQAPMPLDNRGRNAPDLPDAQERESVNDREAAEGDEDSHQDAPMDAAGPARGSRSSGTRSEASPLGRKAPGQGRGVRALPGQPKAWAKDGIYLGSPDGLPPQDPVQDDTETQAYVSDDEPLNQEEGTQKRGGAASFPGHDTAARSGAYLSNPNRRGEQGKQGQAQRGQFDPNFRGKQGQTQQGQFAHSFGSSAQSRGGVAGADEGSADGMGAGGEREKRGRAAGRAGGQERGRGADIGAILADMGLDAATFNMCTCCAHPQGAAGNSAACCSKVRALVLRVIS